MTPPRQGAWTQEGRRRRLGAMLCGRMESPPENIT